MDNQISYFFLSQPGLTVHYLHLLFRVIQDIQLVKKYSTWPHFFMLALIYTVGDNGNVNVKLAPFPS
jgi:hypothetical protein